MFGESDIRWIRRRRMKKVIYSAYTKILIGIMFVVSILAAVTTGLELWLFLANSTISRLVIAKALMLSFAAVALII